MATQLMVTLETDELGALPPSKAEQIRATFLPMADALQGFEDEYNAVMAEAAEEVTPSVSSRARRLRLDIAKVRVAAEKARVAVKAEYLLATKAIDGTNNILKWAISQKEEALEAIEKHAERMEEERRAALHAERSEALFPFVDILPDIDFSAMDADVWAAYLATKQRDHADRIEAERKAEEARAAEAERIRVEQEAIRAENERLRAEAAAAEAERRKEMARLEEERRKEELARRAELARIEAERQKEREAIEAERQRLAALEAAEAERKARAEAEEKARRAAEREAAKAPVKKRLKAWVDSFALPDLPGEQHEVAERVRQKFEAFQAWAKTEIEGGV